MSSENELLVSWIAEALTRARQSQSGQGAIVPDSATRDPTVLQDQPDDIGRMVEMIEALAAEVPDIDLAEVEAVFAAQAAALNVIFSQFTRAAGHKHAIFDSMRVALRAQAQSRLTYNSLIALKPARTPGSKALRNSDEQTIESVKSPACRDT